MAFLATRVRLGETRALPPNAAPGHRVTTGGAANGDREDTTVRAAMNGPRGFGGGS